MAAIARRAAIALAATALAWPGAARAEDPPADRAGIQAVITHQLEAFQRDDAAGAYGYAAPGIQQMFGTADRFMTMVRTAYPPVYRPKSYSFGELSSEQGLIVQRVELVGPDGRAALALYTMEQQPDGSWRISGCSLTASENLAT